MKKRVFTSIFIVLASMLAIFSKLLPNAVGDYIFDIFVLFICFVASGEMANMQTANQKAPNKIFSTFYIVLNYVVFLMCQGNLNIGFVLLVELAVLVGYIVLVCLYEFLTNTSAGFKTALKTSLYTLINCVYPTFLFALLIQINHIQAFVATANIDISFIVMIFAVTMLTDTFAYLIGSTFKGPKLAPNISPNKTISGAIGGLFGGVVGAMAVFVVMSFYAGWQPILSAFNLSWWHFVLIGFVASAIGQVGDLFESWLKRRSAVKDSGDILPGHGGFLDRIDAMIFVTTFIYIVLICLIL